MRFHDPLWQGQVDRQAFSVGLEFAQIEIGRLQKALHRQAVEKLRVDPCRLDHPGNLLLGHRHHLLADAGDNAVERVIPAHPPP